MTIVSTSTAYALVPSQVRGVPQYHRSKQKKTTTNEGNDATRSTPPLRATVVEGGDGPPGVRATAGGVIESSSSVAASATAGDYDVVCSPAMASTAATPTLSITENKSTNGKKQNKKKSCSSSTKKNTHRSTRQQQCKTGNIPDVSWRSISMNHLRAHPNFQPLPPPSLITNLPSREHVRYFRQDSWQWDYLHTGRCTTSQASSALGFLEAKCASYLGIPKSLQRGGCGAFDRLRQCYYTSDDQSLVGWERTLCSSTGQRRSMSTTAAAAATTTATTINEDDAWSWKPGTKETERLWKSQLHNKSYPFSAMYRPTLTHADLYRRKVHLGGGGGGGGAVAARAPIRTRMEWGNVQEATSILTALNYFCTIDNTTIIREVGMCGASFDDDVNATTTDETMKLLQGVKIGASPDAIICHGNGSVEVLEVKNHCPFVWNRVSNNNSNRYNKHQRMEIERQRGNRSQLLNNNNDTNESHRFSIRDFELEQKIPPAYLPQLMMEMLCVGTSITLHDEESTTNNSTSTGAVVGPICNSAIMVRQTATKGAIILRLHRDDDWINEMKYWLGMFQANYVSTNTIPNDNFFWCDDPDSRYRKFVARTKEISEGVELVAYIDHSQIQRMLLCKGEEGRGGLEGGEIPLFLDSIIAEVS